MLTPAFELSQEDDFLTLIIKARFARVSETEIFVDGKAFKFYSKPYFLRLTLPGALVEDGRETANYDSEKGYFTIRFPKETPGEKFDGLDMLTQLMAPSGSVSASEPCIELIAPEDEDGKEADQERQGEEDDDEEVEDEDVSWEVDQTPCSLDEDEIVGSVKYGFAGRRSGVFSRLQEELSSIVDVPDPDHMTAKDRRESRRLEEAEKFDDEHYLADLYQDDMIQPLLDYKPPWQLMDNDGLDPSPDLIKFSESEREKMLKLSPKKFLLDKTMEREAYMGLLDLIYAYAYNHRSTEGENSVESAWTICKLSTTLSWLDTHSTPREVLFSAVRRSLCYPLHRHWQLAVRTVEDVKAIFSLGRSQILKGLLEVHRLLAEDDPRYILNDLYITDYCIWVQGLPHENIQKIASSLDKVQILKNDVELELEQLEAAARCVLEEDGEEMPSPTIAMHGYPHILAAKEVTGVVNSNQGNTESSKEETSKSEAESGEGRVQEEKETRLVELGNDKHLPAEAVGGLDKEMASLMIERSKINASDTTLDSDDDSG